MVKKTFSIRIGRKRFIISKGKPIDGVYGAVSALFGMGLTSVVMDITNWYNYPFFFIFSNLFAFVFYYKFNKLLDKFLRIKR